jgi:DNA-binding GntR family transcriptional regulator
MSRELRPGGGLVEAVVIATKAEAVYKELRAGILDGSLPPGFWLDQKALAEGYAVSTTPVREALRRLEAEQLVVVRPHHGPRVAPLSVQELHYLFQVRLELDPLAGRLAADLATDEQRAGVRRLLERTHESAAERVFRNRDFHRAIYEACGNPVLVQVLQSLWNRCDRYRFLLATSHDAEHEAQEERDHDAMVSALEQGDGDRLHDLVRQHIERSYRNLVALAEEFTTLSPAAGE